MSPLAIHRPLRPRRGRVVRGSIAAVFLVLSSAGAAPAREGDAALRWHLEEGAVSHRRAVKACDRSEADGRSDWRLPTTAELRELGVRATAGDAAARAVLTALEGAAAWSREVSPSGLAWVAAFAHGYLFRIHEANTDGLQALCVAGVAPPGAVGDGAIDDAGDWRRPLESDSESALLWPCTGDEQPPRVLDGSLRAFRRGLPPGPLRETIQIDFVVDARGHARYVAPSPSTPDRLARLAVTTLQTFRYEPATCDGDPIPVFYRLDFGG